MCPFARKYSQYGKGKVRAPPGRGISPLFLQKLRFYRFLLPFSLNFPGTVLGGRLIVDAGLFVVQHKCIIANAAGHDGAAGQRRVIVNEELLQDLIDEAEDEWFEQKHRLNVAFYKLNESGREKALERIEFIKCYI